MFHPLFSEAVLRAAARRGWISADRIAPLTALLLGHTPQDLPDRLRQAGYPVIAEHLNELLAPVHHPGFGRWRPLARLGGGAMGAVWLAAGDDTQLVVVKTALNAGRAPLIDESAGGSVWTGGSVEKPSVSADAELALRFAREARITAGMQHPRIVPCLDGGVANDGTRYLVLAWVQAGDLSARLKRDGPLPAATVLAIADQLADALDHAHTRGVIHRDLKPANVFLHDDGSVLLGDFGLARPTSAGATRLTLAGVAVGTPNAMAPEQIDGRSSVDGRADIYALGCLICECLTGRPPFCGRSAEVMHAHRTAPPPDLDALVPGLPPGTAALVARMMAKRPEERPGTAAEVRQALAPLLQACAQLPKPPTATPPTPRAVPDSTTDAVLLHGDGDTPALVLWAGSRLVLGKQRAPGTDLVVRDYPEEQHRTRIARISRRHAALAIAADGAVTIEDLGSANGSFLAGERIPAQTPRRLADDSAIELGLAGSTSLWLRPTSSGAVVVERRGNRPELAYALVRDGITIGAPGSDLPLPGATRQVRLQPGSDGWRADGNPLPDTLDLGGPVLRRRALGDWL